MATKAKSGKFDCYKAAADDEPIFVLRAKDPLAPMLVRMWAWMREYSRPIGREPDKSRELAKRDEAESCATAMEEWRDTQPGS